MRVLFVLALCVLGASAAGENAATVVGAMDNVTGIVNWPKVGSGKAVNCSFLDMGGP